MHPTGKIRIRSMTDLADFRRCEELQREAWGFEDLDIVPAPMFTIAAHHGGIVMGAYDGNLMIGFVYSLPALLDKEWIQYSHMLAVVKAYRRHRIGLRLKAAQGRAAMAAGFKTIAWTYDPLQARNASLNLGRLGAEAGDYYVNLYGETSSPLHHGLPTDRLLARWMPGRAKRARWKPNAGDAPIIYDCSKKDFLRGRAFRFAIPADIEDLKSIDSEAALDWQQRLRGVFLAAFKKGFRAVDFQFDKDKKLGHYLLIR